MRGQAKLVLCCAMLELLLAGSSLLLRTHVSGHQRALPHMSCTSSLPPSLPSGYYNTDQRDGYSAILQLCEVSPTWEGRPGWLAGWLAGWLTG